MRTGRIALAVAACACALHAPPARAESGLEKKACGGAETDVYERLACKQQGIVEAQGWLTESGLKTGPVAEELMKRGFEQRHARALRTMKGLHDRAVKANGRTTKEHFKQAVEKQRKSVEGSCALRLLERPLGTPVGDVDGNGVCDLGKLEVCASERDPTVACDPSKLHGNGVCARICGVDGGATALAAGDPETAVAEDLVAAYDDVETSFVEMNGELAALQAQPAFALAVAAAGDDPCAAVENPPKALETASKVLKIADVVLQGAAKIADKACGQTVVVVGVAAGFGGGGGGNGSAICAVIETASAVASTANAVVEIALGWARDDMQESTFECLQKSVADLKVLQAAVDQNAAQLAAEMADVRAKMAAGEARLTAEIVTTREDLRAHLLDVILLLNTPQGLRDAFPAK